MDGTFMVGLKDTLEKANNVSVTENGAVGYRTTGTALLDLNFCVSSYRNIDNDNAILAAFNQPWNEDPILALKWLFFARDIRGGLGERRFFRVIFKNLARMINVDDAVRLIKLIPEYGRWDDMFIFFGTELQSEVLEIIQYQLREDKYNMDQHKSISLLAKWMPSINASSRETRQVAKVIAEFMGLSEGQYRKMLSSFRKYIDVVEVKMTDNEWNKINYQAVPSKANLLYSKSFMKHDEDRRSQFLADLESGESKINSGALYPYEILQKVIDADNNLYAKELMDEYKVAVQMWNSLPNTIADPTQSTIVVCDGSSSMNQLVGNTKTNAQLIAWSLAIYFAEKLHGEFKDKVISFSMNPVFIDLSSGENVVDKLHRLQKYREVANTNIERVFQLLLTTAVRYKMKQEDIPSNIVILSDMEFDRAARCNEVAAEYGTVTLPTSLFETIEDMWADYGYKLPRLVFWNLASRSMTIPMKENDLGVCLVSGFSPNIADMVMSAETDPFETLKKKLLSERYKPINLTFDGNPYK